MTIYTTTAIATSSADNTVTVASIANMFPGLPITFSGATFGGITTGSTYYIGTITYGYPTSKITLSSLPGGATFVLTTASGSMTATWESGGQLIIDTNPPGESLNSAFTKINVNFDQIWAAGPVNSNIRIADNTISTLDTNGDLILNPNGIGNVVANAHVIPDQTLIRNLGAPTRYWNELYVGYAEVGNIDVGQVTIPVGNLHILGGNAGQFLQTTDGAGTLDWAIPTAAAGGNNTQIQYNNNDILDGSDSFTFNANTNTITLQNVTTTGQANLNSVGNVIIVGGAAGYVLQTDGLGNLSWTSPTGNITQILDQQFYGDSSTLTFNLITPSVTKAVLVTINGVLQIPDVAYTVASDTITFSEAPLISDLVDIRFLVFGSSSNSAPGGADGFIQFNSAGDFGGSANLRYYANTGNLYSTNVQVAGNVTASYYRGDGSLLTGITAIANTGTITFANNVIGTSNANAAINILAPQQTSVSQATGGNAAVSQLLWATNISALSPAQIPNGVVGGNTWGTQISVGNTGAVIGSNSAVGLRTWTFGTDGILSSAGGINAGNINATGAVSATGTITANVDISAVGNVAGTYVLGNGALLTGLPAAYGNSDVANYLNGSIGNVIPVASNAYSLGNATNQWLSLWVSNNTIYMNSVPITLGAGNVLSVAGNPVVTVASNAVANIGNFVFNANALQNSNGGSFDNGSLVEGATAGLTLPVNGSGSAQLFNTYGPITVVTGTDVGNTRIWSFADNGNLSLPGGGLLGNPYGDGANNAGLQAGPGGYAAINSANLQQYVQTDDTAVYVGTNYGVASRNWIFDKAGNLTLPNIANPSINYANGLPYGGGGSTNTGNIRFGGDNIYNLEGNSQGILISSTPGAGLDGSIYLPYANENGALTIVNDSGVTSTIELAIGNSSWVFDHGGNLTLPGNTSSINYANGNPYGGTDTGNITFSNATISTPTANTGVDVYLKGGNATGVAQPGGNTIIQAGQGTNFGTSGNVVVQSGNNFIKVWTFNNNGNITLPGGGILGNTYGDNANAVGLQAGPGGYAVINSANRQQYVQADNTAVYIGTNHGVANTIWAFDTTGNLTLPGNTSSINYANGQPYGGSNSNPFDQDLNTTDSVTFANISATGNIVTTNGNISGADYITGNFFVGDGSQLTGITVTANTGNITFNNSTVVGPSFGVAPSANSSVYIQPTIDSATAYQFSGSNMSAPGNVSAVGNIAGNYILGNGSQLTGLPATYGNSNVTTLFAAYGSNTISTTGNITAGNFVGNGSTLSNVATQVTGSWNVPVGNSTQSFTVNSGTYSMWVDCNIPNGILVWNATATVTNTNVPVVGYQYAWVYNGGGTPIDFTSIPNQFVGTANTIVRSSVAPSATTNRFDFGIRNTSGGNVTVRYGYTKL